MCAAADVPAVPFGESKLLFKSEFFPTTHNKIVRIDLPHAHMGHEEFWDDNSHGRTHGS